MLILLLVVITILKCYADETRIDQQIKNRKNIASANIRRWENNMNALK